MSERTGVVYFIETVPSRRIKIGFTSGDPRNRLADLQVGNHERLQLLLTIVGTVETEAAFHARFIHHHIQGEWFQRGIDLLAFIDGCRAMATGKVELFAVPFDAYEAEEAKLQAMFEAQKKRQHESVEAARLAGNPSLLRIESESRAKTTGRRWGKPWLT